MDFKNIYIIFYPNTKHFTHQKTESISKIDHILGQKIKLDNLFKNEIIPHILFHHNTVKLKLNSKQISST